MSLREYVEHELDRLDEAKLKQVADYLAFLKFQSRVQPPAIDETAMASLYAEFAEEDRELAEEGLNDYVQALAAEDRQ